MSQKVKDIKSRGKINIPNVLTLLRILLIPIFLYFYLVDDYSKAFWLFFLAGVTDFFDGLIARRFGRKTTLGAILDPAADKLLMNSSFVVLSVVGTIPWWLTALVFARDLLIVLGLAFLKKHHRKLYFSPTLLSKWNTFLQLFVLFISFLMAYLHSSGIREIGPFSSGVMDRSQFYLYLLTGGMTALSGIQYTRIGIRILKGQIQYADLPIKKSEISHQ